MKFWLRWYALNLLRYVVCILVAAAGMLLLAVSGLRPWDGSLLGSEAVLILLLNYFFPITASVYLLLLVVLGRSGRPRLWAYLLTPIFWGPAPYLAFFPVSPPLAAMWLAILVFAAIVELPPPEGTQRSSEAFLCAPERPATRQSR